MVLQKVKPNTKPQKGGAKGLYGPKGTFASAAKKTLGKSTHVNRRRPKPNAAYIRIRNLPYTVEKTEVLSFFKGYGLSANDIAVDYHLVGANEGKPNGQAFVQLNNGSQQEKALAELNGITIDERKAHLDEAEWDEYDRAANPIKEAVYIEEKHQQVYRAAATSVFEPSPAQMAQNEKDTEGQDGPFGMFGKGKGKDGKGKGKKGYMMMSPYMMKGKGKGKKGGKKGMMMAMYMMALKGWKGKGKGAGKGLAKGLTGRRGEESTTRKTPEPNDNDGLVAVRNIPYTSDASDIIACFADYDVNEENVYICVGVDGTKSGSALMRLDSADTAAQVVENCQKLEIGERKVDIYKSSEEDLLDHLARGDIDGQEQWEEEEWGEPGANCEEYSVSDRNYADSGDGVVRIRGLPYSITPEGVIEMVGDDYQLTTSNIMIVKRDGKSTGCAFLKFHDEDHAAHALKELDQRVVTGDNGEEISLIAFASSHLEMKQCIKASAKMMRR